MSGITMSTERITLRVYDPWSDQFIKPIEGISATFREQPDGCKQFVISDARARGAMGTPVPDSQIIRADGSVWTVTKVIGRMVLYTCTVEPIQ